MYDFYENPLCTRYAGRKMQEIFGDRHRIGLWRRLWLALAESEKELGLPITEDQLNEMREHLVPSDEEFAVAAEREKAVFHDVMSHIYAFGEVCPKAKPIIHLGATSCFVTDNSELIQMYEGLEVIKGELAEVIELISKFASENADLPCLGYTHFQAAQFTTLGKRFSLYLQDFVSDYKDLCALEDDFRLRGAKGTTGTQASFMELFADPEKVKKLDKMIAEKMGFKGVFSVTGQTYPRKFDFKVQNVLAGIAVSSHKFAVDMRLMQSMKEAEEPFGASQIGSSAMAYKRNPMKCERICALSRYVESLPANGAVTASTQWLERTLDDSANRRLVNAQAFLATDGILSLVKKVVSGIRVNEKVIAKRLEAELPFISTENILMRCVEKGGDRQELHERIRVLSMQAAENVKNGGENDLWQRMEKDEVFRQYGEVLTDRPKATDYIGRAPEQTREYVAEVKAYMNRMKASEGKKRGEER